MGWLRKKKIQKRLTILFFAALILPAVFAATGNILADDGDGRDGLGPDGYATPLSTQAATAIGKKNDSSTSVTPAAPPVVTPGTCGNFEVGCHIKNLIIDLLGMFLSFLFRFVMIPAATGFAWTVDPATMTGPSGTLNLPAVYSLWQFIRDFFNLFFILILLFSAFATIFQVDSFNIRNIFKNILLVALFINFSFPITRFLIDAANVPMYYFINDVLGEGGKSGGMIAMQSMFAYSGTGAAAFTNVQDGDMAPLLMGIVFVFLFSISLFVLALMMIVRLIALTMLLIFSPIGFAASLLPGLDKFGREWWENFWKYALFGPAAALMLMISIKFMGAVAGSGIWKSLGAYSSGQSPDAASATFLAQVVFFCIPIIMIWFTIGMAQKSSLVGASVVVGLGYALPKAIGNYTKTKVVNTAKFAGSTAVKATGGVAKVILPVDRVKGAYAGVKESFKDGGKVFGGKVPEFLTGKAWKEAAENRQAAAKGFVQNRSAGVKEEKDALHDRRVKAEIDEMKKNKVNQSVAADQMTSGKSAQSRQAAAMYLAQNDDIRNAAQFRDGLAAVAGNEEFTSEFIKKSQSAITSIADLDTALKALGDDSKTAAAVIDKINPAALPGSATEYSSLLTAPALASVGSQKQLQSKMKKEGRIHAVINHEAGLPGAPSMTSIVDSTLDKMTVEEIARQDDLLRTNPDAHGYVLGLRTTDPEKYQEIKLKMRSGTSALFP